MELGVDVPFDDGFSVGEGLSHFGLGVVSGVNPAFFEGGNCFGDVGHPCVVIVVKSLEDDVEGGAEAVVAFRFEEPLAAIVQVRPFVFDRAGEIGADFAGAEGWLARGAFPFGF